MVVSIGSIWGYCRRVLGISPQTADAAHGRTADQTYNAPAAKLRGGAEQNVTKKTPPADLRAELEAKCDKLAYIVARKSWELEPVDAALKALLSKGAGLAKVLHRQRSDAGNQRKLDRFKALAAEQKRRTAARDRAKAVAQSRSRDLAALGAEATFPKISSVFQLAATLGLTLSFAPTAHDLLTGLDPMLKWVVGGGVSWGVSSLIIHGMLPPNSNGGATEPAVGKADRRLSALLGGLGIGIGLMGVRLVGAETYGDVFLALSLGLVEASVVFMWDKATQSLGTQIDAWMARERGRISKRALAEKAAEDLADRQRLLDEIDAEIAELDRDLELDHVLGDLKLLTSIAHDAIQSGYHRGISDNAGSVKGPNDFDADDDQEGDDENE